MSPTGKGIDRQLGGRTMRTLAVAMFFVAAAMTARQAVAQQTCPSLVVTNNNDVVNGDTSSPCALIAFSGGDGISLREALLAANNATGSGTVTISFAPSLAGATIALTGRFAPITRNQITLTGLTNNNGQPNITLDATQAPAAGNILFVAASYFTVTGINWTNFSNIGLIQIGGSGFSLQGQSLQAPPLIGSIVVSGNSFSNGTNNAFAISVQSSVNVTTNSTINNLIILNNTFNNLFEAINIDQAGTGNTMQDFVIYGNSFSQMTSFAGVELSTFAGSGNKILRTQILQNTFSNSAQGVELDNGGGASNNLIDGTLIEGNVFTEVTDPSVGLAGGNGGGCQNNTISNTQIVNNVVNQGMGGIFITDNQDSQEINNKVTGVSTVNNTFVGSLVFDAISVISHGDVSGVTVSNTIFDGNQTSLGGIASSQVSYSIINQSGFTGVNHNFNSDPLFVNSAGGNFELQSGSPARGAGTNAGAPAIDLVCQARGSPPSIGAYEFQGPNICPATYSAPLTANPPVGPAPLAVTFSAGDLPLPMTYTINFGDGTTGALMQSQCIGVQAIVGGRGGIQCSGTGSHSYASGTYVATLLNASGTTVGTTTIAATSNSLPVGLFRHR